MPKEQQERQDRVAVALVACCIPSHGYSYQHL